MANRVKKRAVSESEYDDVEHVDGPFEDCEPGYYEFTFTTEHRERVVVEAPEENYAKEMAEAKRTHRGQYVTTIHTDVRRVEKEEGAE